MYIHPWDIIENQMSGKTSALKFDATSIDRKRHGLNLHSLASPGFTGFPCVGQGRGAGVMR